jgi:hypothetical protein
MKESSFENILLIRPSIKTYIIFTIIWSILIVIGIIASIKTNNWDLPIYWIGIIGLFCSYLLISRYKILLDDKEIIYSSLFSTTILKFTDIKKYEIRSAIVRTDPTVGLYIFNLDNSIAMVINIKLFSLYDINQLLSKLPN